MLVLVNRSIAGKVRINQLKNFVFLKTLSLTQCKRPMFLSSGNHLNDSQCKLTDYYSIERTIALNPFCVTVPFLYPLKTSENLWVSDNSRWHRKTSGMKEIIT